MINDSKMISNPKSKSQRCGYPSMIGGTCAINVDFEDSLRNIFPFTNKYGAKQVQWFGFLPFPEVNTTLTKKPDNKSLTRNPQLQINYVQKDDKSFKYIPTNFISYFDMQRLFLSKADFSNNTVFGLNGPPLKKNYNVIVDGDKKRYEYIKLAVILRFTADGKYQLTDKKAPITNNAQIDSLSKEDKKNLDITVTKDKKNSEDSKKIADKKQTAKVSVEKPSYDPTTISLEDEEEYKAMKIHPTSGIPTVLLSSVLNNVTLEINDGNINFMDGDNQSDKCIFKYICEEYKKKFIIFGYINTPMLDKLKFQLLDKSLLVLIPGFGRSNYCHTLMKQRNSKASLTISKRRRKTKIEKLSNKRKNRSPPAPNAI